MINLNNEFSFKANRPVRRSNADGSAKDLFRERDTNMPKIHEVGEMGQFVEGVRENFRALAANAERFDSHEGDQKATLDKSWSEIISDAQVEAGRKEDFLTQIRNVFPTNQVISISQNSEDPYQVVRVDEAKVKNKEEEPQIIAIQGRQLAGNRSVFMGGVKRVPISEAMKLNPTFLSKFLKQFPNKTPITFRNPVTGRSEKAIVGELIYENNKELPLINILIESDWQTISAVDFVKFQPAVFKPEAGPSDSSGRWIKTFG